MGRTVKYEGNGAEKLLKALCDAYEYQNNSERFDKIIKAMQDSAAECAKEGAGLAEAARSVHHYFPPFIDMSGFPLTAMTAYAWADAGYKAKTEWVQKFEEFRKLHDAKYKR